MLAIWSGRPDVAEVLVFSPDVQRLRQEVREPVAMDYLRELLEEAQQQWRELERGGKNRR